MIAKKKIHRIGITSRKEIDTYHKNVLDHILHCLVESKKEVFLSKKARENLPEKHPEILNISDLPMTEKLDLLIVLGGDGTILSAVRKLPHLETYVLGINVGSLGFLSEIPPDNLENTCLTIWDANYTIDERMLLNVKVQKKNGEPEEFRALNELVVSQSAVARLVEIPTKIDDIELTVFRADGLIIATATGSTAYNLSAGGPILHPRIEAMILTPIAPFSLTQKPLVIPGDKTVSLEIVDCNKEEIVMSLDGQIHKNLECGDIIHITQHHETVKFLRLPEENYFKTLRGKLKWGENI